ncbi:protein translocase subunit [Toensbergia leucococca]|nr:protein translocase subunit [Toensbergia leucococca]
MDINNTLDISSPKAAIISSILRETAMNNARQLIGKLNEHCFEKCISSPSTSLSKKDDTCLTQCMEKYMATWNTVSRQFIGRIKTAETTDRVVGLGLDM